MPLTSSIQPYDPQWPQRYADEAARLTPIFGSALVELHHVGSTGVPGLAAKPEIDILAVVNSTDVPKEWIRSFEKLGYRRGGDLSPGHRFFKRDIDEVRIHKLHVCREGHPTVAQHTGHSGTGARIATIHPSRPLVVFRRWLRQYCSSAGLLTSHGFSRGVV
jgi:GrpB-like predicted nucleotidyltransferase (UPF0157 family)